MRSFKIDNQLREGGQAIIEFVLGLMIVISFFFFYVKLAAVFAIGNYIHYATFMSARAYFSSNQSISDQQSRAESVLTAMVGGRWRSMIKPKGGNSGAGKMVGAGSYYDDDPKRNYWNQGTTYNFESALSVYPWSQGGEALTLKLRSESWMGREESTDECSQKMRALKGKLNATLVYWENGNDGC